MYHSEIASWMLLLRRQNTMVSSGKGQHGDRFIDRAGPFLLGNRDYSFRRHCPERGTGSPLRSEIERLIKLSPFPPYKDLKPSVPPRDNVPDTGPGGGAAPRFPDSSFFLQTDSITLGHANPRIYGIG